jgi:uncharacterized membrane protein YphA (DoxX/SURF4 family)
MNIALWVVAGSLAVFFAIGGWMKLAGRFDSLFTHWDYTLDTARMIGILEITGAVGLLFKRTTGWSAVGLITIMLGAAGTMLVYGEYVWLIAPVVVCLILAFVAWGRGLPLRTKVPTEVAPGMVLPPQR